MIEICIKIVKIAQTKANLPYDITSEPPAPSWTIKANSTVIDRGTDDRARQDLWKEISISKTQSRGSEADYYLAPRRRRSKVRRLRLIFCWSLMVAYSWVGFWYTVLRESLCDLMSVSIILCIILIDVLSFNEKDIWQRVVLHKSW